MLRFGSRRLFVALSFLMFAAQLRAQATEKVWILFRDKGSIETSWHAGDRLYDSTLNALAPATISRRMKALRCDRTAVLAIEDAPISNENYLTIRALGITPINTSRWINAISAKVTEAQIRQLTALDAVKEVRPVLRSPSIEVLQERSVTKSGAHAVSLVGQLPPDSLAGRYGPSESQLSRINVLPLHALGFDATNVHIGFLDTGFRWRAIDALKSRNVVAEYDFVFKDSVTGNQENDQPGQDGHGTGVLSAATGYAPDELIGPAYNATITLAKTEDGRSETPREEDNYAAALEWMETTGVQLTTSSLGYLSFDSGFVSHTYRDLDGKTTIAARAVHHATQLGLLCLNAMGNSGNSVFPYMLTPADADSMISVGALDANDSIAGFSSRGPTSDGRIKPEICAPGIGVHLADVGGGFYGGTGTSFATPLVAGSCALIMQAHPEASAQEIRRAILTTGSRSTVPDTAYGWGRLNAYGAALELGTVIGPPRISVQTATAHLRVGVASNNGIKTSTVLYGIGADAPLWNRQNLSKTDSLHFEGDVNSLPPGTVIRYAIEVRDSSDTLRYLPRNPAQEVFTFTVGGTIASEVVQTKPSIVIEPNPAGSGKATLLFDYNPGGTVYLYDESGREMSRVELQRNVASNQLDLSQLANGAYFVRFFETGRGVTEPSAQTKLIVKR
jgi:hypothetical protein